MRYETISISKGKGSIAHNTRAFNADNIDPSRSKYNIQFVHQTVKQAYHQLFDTALANYNAKQTRSDRIITDYYEKIRTGLQEKTCYEILVQVGNMNTMNAKSKDGQIAKEILIEYMEDFIKRNTTLHVFSAHLHMDEETPHLHIDFIPYITGSKRGLETRVSLKQAMNKLGFSSKGKAETEYSLWQDAEKEHLANIMKKHDIKWLQKGTHNEHLSVYDFKKQERKKEIKALENQIQTLNKQLQVVAKDKKDIVNLPKQIPKEVWTIPDPKLLMSANSYKSDYIIPMIKKIRNLVQNFMSDYIKLKAEVSELRTRIIPLNEKIKEQKNTIDQLIQENHQNSVQLNKIKKVLGHKQFNDLLNIKKTKNKKIEKNND